MQIFMHWKRYYKTVSLLKLGQILPGFLGDLLGRGPHPEKVIQWVMGNLAPFPAPEAWIIGNHESIYANLMTEEESQRVNKTPKEIIQKHRSILQENETISKFVSQEFVPARTNILPVEIGGTTHLLTHGGLVDPRGFNRYVYPWEKYYLQNEFSEMVNLKKRFNTPLVTWFGHTHVPCLVSSSENGENIDSVFIQPFKTYPLDMERFWLINPGSVGQPRDLDYRPSYAVVDMELNTIVFRRGDYLWRETDKDFLLGGYPDSLRRKLRKATMVNNVPEIWLKHFESNRIIKSDKDWE